MPAETIDHETTSRATPDDRAGKAPATDAFVKALLERRPAAIAPPAREERATVERQRGVPILARSLFRDLVHHGFEAVHLVALSTELIALTASLLRLRAVAEREGPEADADLAVVGLGARSGS
jgi:hypothetical protein